MAKKKAPSKTAPPKAQKKVSVKKIVAEINRTLKKVEKAKTTMTQAQARGAGPDPRGHALDRAIMSLRGARDVIEGTCVPGFDIPF